ncbi:olfactory receptor 12D1-like [Pelobates fuscus]|uniref:olfactory receptor 12D1-like n=1 Tax=Pelobates fuscus TaxID=191477 RepID=UPI002FE4D25B
MDTENHTLRTHFVLFGLTNKEELQVPLFVCFLILYMLILAGNFAIILVIILDRNLHTPMYFFLWNLSLLDICYSCVIVPNMLYDFLIVEKIISFGGCISQIHFFHFFGSTEVILYSAMSFDRFVAIGYPLRYTNIVSTKVCMWLISASWVTGFFHALIHAVMTARLPFCGPNLVKHYFCDVKPVLRLACADTSLNVELLNKVTGTVVTAPLCLTLLSYLFIGKFLIKIRTSEGRKRAFSTCSAHLTAVSIQYGAVLFTYMRPSTQDSLNEERASTILFTVITPMLNPVIYTLRNTQMKEAMKRVLRRLLF